MGLMPAGSRNPFVRMDEQTVVGMLKATGARDRDVLHAHKAELLAQPKQLKLLAIICIVVGALFTMTVILAIAGIPSILFGVWTWRFGQRNAQAVEDGFTRYAQTIAA